MSSCSVLHTWLSHGVAMADKFGSAFHLHLVAVWKIHMWRFLSLPRRLQSNSIPLGHKWTEVTMTHAKLDHSESIPLIVSMTSIPLYSPLENPIRRPMVSSVLPVWLIPTVKSIAAKQTSHPVIHQVSPDARPASQGHSWSLLWTRGQQTRRSSELLITTRCYWDRRRGSGGENCLDRKSRKLIYTRSKAWKSTSVGRR